MPRLIVEKGADKGKMVRINKKVTVLVGRDQKANFRLTDALSSRLHFKIEPRGEGIFVCDLKSMNGTWVNGSRIDEHKLEYNDKIQIGETLFSFLQDEEKGDKENLIGKSIQGYTVRERLGRGGMGTVYLAEQMSLKRPVALKILSPELVKDQNFITLFEQEAHAAAALNHPNIVQVYDFGKGDNLYFFSMEFLSGGSVQDLLSREKRLTPKRAVRIALEAARGLEYAEKKKIVHRDIKPDNLMIGEDEVIKIGDLGLAKTLKEGKAAQEEGTILGTPHYVAPEQALGKPVDPRVDIYALGATLYRMVAGTTPYSGNTVKEILIRKVREEPPALKSIDPELPDSLVGIVERMMAKDPEQRYQSAAQVLPDLVHLRDELDGRTTNYPATNASVDTMLQTVLPDNAPTQARRSPLPVFAVLLALAFVVGGFLGLRDWGNGDPSANNGNVPVANNQPNEAYLDLARLLYEKAVKSEPRELKDSKDVDVAVAAYEELLRKCPMSPQAEQARTRLEALERKRDELKRMRLVKEEEDLATGAADAALKNVFSTQEAYWKRPVELEPVEKAVAALAALLEKGARDGGVKGTGVEGRVREKAATAEKWITETAPRIRQVVEVEARVDELAGQNHFRQAIEALGKLKESLKDPQFDARLAKLAEGVQTTERNWMDQQVREAMRQAEARNYQVALDLLTAVEAELSLSDLLNKLRKVRGEIEDNRKDDEIAAAAARRRREEQELEAAYARAVVLMARPTYNYVDAGKLLEELVARITDDAVRKNAQAILELVQLERGAWQAFQKKAQDGELSGKTFFLQKSNVRIFDVDATQIVVSEDGKNKFGMRFDKISAQEIAQTLSEAWSPTQAQAIGIGLFAARRGLTDLAGKAFKKGAAASDPLLATLSARLNDKREALAGQDAAALYRAGKALAAGQPAETTQMYRLIADQYSGTDAFKNQRTAIEKWIREHP